MEVIGYLVQELVGALLYGGIIYGIYFLIKTKLMGKEQKSHRAFLIICIVLLSFSVTADIMQGEFLMISSSNWSTIFNSKERSPEVGTTRNLSEINFSTYENDSYGIEFEYPSYWSSTEKKENQIVGFSNPEGTVSFLVFSAEIEGSWDLETRATAAINNAKQKLSDFNLIKRNRTTFNGFNASEVIYSGVTSGYNVKFKQIYILKDRKVYIINYAASQSSYDNSLPIAQKMIDSFKFKD